MGRFVTADEFRRLVMSLPEAVSVGHMGHPDFCVRGKRFASLGADQKSAMLKLTIEQQAAFVRCEPKAFQRAAGIDGRRGYVTIQLATANTFIVTQAVLAAWRHRAPKRLVRQFSSR